MVFSFILASSEINIYPDIKHWVRHNNNNPTIHQFQKKLAFNLIRNEWLKYEQDVVVTRKKGLRLRISMNMLLHLLRGRRETRGILHQKIGDSNISVGDIIENRKYEHIVCVIPQHT